MTDTCLTKSTTKLLLSGRPSCGFKRGQLIPALLALILSIACQVQPIQVFIEVDGGRQSLTTDAADVRGALDEADINLDPLDRVKPDLYTRLEPGMVIIVTRVTEEIETEREVVPYEQRTVVNAALTPGETRLAQAGVNGEDEVSLRVTYENGTEVGRSEISRVTIIEPVPEILVVGPRGELPAMPVEGTIAYLSNGNAWLMRDSNRGRRPLTTEGNLDGRVFTLSPDGRYLLYTKKITDEMDLPLNELNLAPTTIVGEDPISLPVTGVLHATWSPTSSQSLVAYSTAERSANAPGWRANNDLWLLRLEEGKPASKPMNLLPANTQGLYPWWGATFTWSPSGDQLAYARADQIGIINLTDSSPVSASIVSLLDFVPLKTFSEWVWAPGISWSPDGKFIAAVVHGEPLASEPAEESPVFDLWLLDAGGELSVKAAERVGMWANPAWGEAGIAFGQALNPLQSASSRYSIQLIDRDGSNRRQLFPFDEELGVEFPEMVWLPQGGTLLFIYNGNLYSVDDNGSPPRQLTNDSQVSHISWVAEAPPVTNTGSLTGATGITGTTSLTSNVTSSITESISAPVTGPESGQELSDSHTPPANGETAATPTLTQTGTPPGTPAPIQPTTTVTASNPTDQEDTKRDTQP